MQMVNKSENFCFETIQIYNFNHWKNIDGAHCMEESLTNIVYWPGINVEISIFNK